MWLGGKAVQWRVAVDGLSSLVPGPEHDLGGGGKEYARGERASGGRVGVLPGSWGGAAKGFALGWFLGETDQDSAPSVADHGGIEGLLRVRGPVV